MAESFQAYHAAGSISRIHRYKYVYEPKPFLFYGTLTDRLKLQEVLQLPSPPVLKPARTKTYSIMLWCQYPALVDGPMNSYVHGMTCVIGTEQQLKMLEEYETRAYKLRDIQIEIEGEIVSGRTFIWAKKDRSELAEGTWSLEEWRRGVEEEMASHFRPVEDFDQLKIKDDGS
jgi:gamma-glutamylcyclotransferase (GGCT)/AIG2-like uncharacterized protein YtfP